MIKLVSIQNKDRESLWTYLQRYLQEMSSFYDDLKKENESYPYEYFDDYFINLKRIAYFIYSDDALVGFALICPYSFINQNPDFALAEFTIFPEFRRKGLASKAMKLIFEKHKGNWEIKYSKNNEIAKNVWTKITSKYQPEKHQINEDEVVLTFNNSFPFKLYKKTPNDIKYGKLFTFKVNLPLLYSPSRTIRVYLPENFDENKKYPLLIMSDGQNIVDKYTSAFGAWNIDERQHELIKEGYPSFIVVGIDCPKDPLHRAMEYSFPFIKLEYKEEGVELRKRSLEFESHLLYKYIDEELLPLIRKHFPVSSNPKDIAVGGSSMGGVFAFSMMSSYPKDIGFALCFSPGFFLYDEKETNKYVSNALKSLKDNKFYFYTGNVGFESKFLERTKAMYQYLIDKGYNKDNIRLLIDEKGEHCEACWSIHFNEAIRFWLDKRR